MDYIAPTQEAPAMSHHASDLLKPWKIVLPATLAGKVEYKLFDHIHNKPRYGIRGKLIVSLLEYWLAREEGRELPSIPSIEELRNS